MLFAVGSFFGGELHDVNHWSDLIKYGANIFNICSLVALPYAEANLDLGLPLWSLMIIDVIQSAFQCDRLFSISINNPNV